MPSKHLDYNSVYSFIYIFYFFLLTWINLWNFRVVLTSPKSIQATVTLLENLHVILEKTPREDVRSEILPLLFNSFESNTIQVQVRIILMVNETKDFKILLCRRKNIFHSYFKFMKIFQFKYIMYLYIFLFLLKT